MSLDIQKPSNNSNSELSNKPSNSITSDNDNKESVKIAVITGGASGIGKGIAIKCGVKKFDIIILIDINKNQLDITKKELCLLHPNTNIICFADDITKRENITNIVNKLNNNYSINTITHLFNNAGVADGKATLIDNSHENINRLHRMMDINFWSHIYVTQTFLPLLKNNNNNESYIINTASISAQMQCNDMYGITKHAIAAYTETLYNELKDTNINVFCLCPGYVNTSLVKNSAMLFNDYQTDKQYKEKVDQYQAKWLQGGGIPVQQVADKIFDSIESEQPLFWINTHQQATADYATQRCQSMINETYD